jgi:hypothetical protein
MACVIYLNEDTVCRITCLLECRNVETDLGAFGAERRDDPAFPGEFNDDHVGMPQIRMSALNVE